MFLNIFCMYIVLIILWLALGCAAWSAMYYTFVFQWYKDFNEDYRKSRYSNGLLKAMYITSPLVIIMGLFSLLTALVILLVAGYEVKFYFKIP